MALGVSAPAIIAAPVAPGDSIATVTLGTLSQVFADRFINGLEAVRGHTDTTEYVRAGRRMFLSSDGLHMAFSVDLVTSRSVVVDGVPGRTYGWTSRVVFSREGGHFAYLAGPSEKAGPVLVVDGRAIQLGVYVFGGVRLSADGRHWALVARSHPDTTEQCFVVTDRATDRPYDAIGAVTLSWDGSHRAYVARRWGRHLVVVDGVESPEYDEAMSPVFDLSGTHMAYAYRSGSGWHVVRDGMASESYDAVDPGSLRFSADGQRLAYVAHLDRSAMLFVDGEQRGGWSGVLTDSSCFSPDGKHTLVWTQNARGWVPALDDSELAVPGTDRPGALVFSADSRHFAYTEAIVGSRLMHVVMDGVPGPDCDDVGVPRISADGRHVAYRAVRVNRQLVVLDGIAGREEIVVGNPALDPSGEHEAHFAWLASGHAVAVVDGRPGPEFDWVSPNGPTYLADGSLQYLAVRNSVLMRVTHVPRGPRMSVQK